ncbi:alpha/beta hydrolase [Streptomyces sp. NPDC002537]
MIAGASVVTLGLIAWPLMTYYEIPPFTDKGEAISFGQNDGKGGQQKADSKALMPLGPHADFKISGTVPEDGSKIAVITYQREKSHFKGKVWVWAPKQYYDPKYKDKGFPVMIALPGGAGFPNNYWMGTNLKLQASVQKLADEGKSLPFIIAMPVLNPENHDKDKHDPVLGRYWDGSDIPGQPKMGTWLTEDVPQLIKENFRTIKSRDGWAFMGSSTGGFAGLKAVVKYPDKFKAVIASGPDIVPDSQLWNPYPKEKAANNPEVLSKQLIAKGGPDVYLAFQYGTLEGSVKSKVDKYIATYGNKGPIHSHLQVIQGGEHDAKDYVKGMNESSLEWISQRMQGPVA